MQAMITQHTKELQVMVELLEIWNMEYQTHSHQMHTKIKNMHNDNQACLDQLQRTLRLFMQTQSQSHGDSSSVKDFSTLMVIF